MITLSNKLNSLQARKHVRNFCINEVFIDTTCKIQYTIEVLKLWYFTVIYFFHIAATIHRDQISGLVVIYNLMYNFY